MQLLSLLISNLHNEEGSSFWNIIQCFSKGDIRTSSDQFGYDLIFTDEMICGK